MANPCFSLSPSMLLLLEETLQDSALLPRVCVERPTVTCCCILFGQQINVGRWFVLWKSSVLSEISSIKPTRSRLLVQKYNKQINIIPLSHSTQTLSRKSAEPCSERKPRQPSKIWMNLDRKVAFSCESPVGTGPSMQPHPYKQHTNCNWSSI